MVYRHYETVRKSSATLEYMREGPVNELPNNFCVAKFPPRKSRNAWTYATSGMSDDDLNGLELYLLSPVETSRHVELLAAIAHFHRTGQRLDLNHTVNFGRPWFPDSDCDHGLISLPYLDGPALEWMNVTHGRSVRILWLIPITRAEKEFAVKNGAETIESRFESAQFNYLDPFRKSVV